VNGTEEYSILKLLRDGGASSLIVIPLLAIMEHITIAKALAGSSRVDSTQEMFAIGLSNLVGSFFGSIPVTGSFSYTTVNHASGVRTPVSGLATGALVLLFLQFLTPYFYHLPTAVLGAVIICRVIFRVDFTILKPMWNTKSKEATK
jgi:sodium-independent sulfate anion transporter 11